MHSALLCRFTFWILTTVWGLGVALPDYANAQITCWSQVGSNNAFSSATTTPIAGSYGGGICVAYLDSVSNLTLAILGIDSNWHTYALPSGFDAAEGYATGAPGAICALGSGVVYIAGNFGDTSGNIVIEWDGANWSKLGDGATALHANFSITTLCTDNAQNLYAAGYFINDSGCEYVAVWNGTTWGPSGLNLSPPYTSSGGPPQLLNVAGMIFVAAYVADTISGHVYTGQNIFVLNYFDLGWTSSPQSFFLGSIGPIAFSNDSSENLYVCSAGKVFVTDITFGYPWTWTQLGTGSTPGNVNTMCTWAHNLYVANGSVDQTGNYYVDRWDGNTWSEFGANNFALHANGKIGSLVYNENNYSVFAIGDFTNSAGYRYGAQSSTIPTGRFFDYLTPNTFNCGNGGSITSTVYNGTQPYTFNWSNGDTTANISGLVNGQYYVTVTDSNGLIATSDITLLGECEGIITGRVFVDTLGNCTYTGSQPGMAGIIVNLTSNGQTSYTTTDANGIYTFAVNDTGAYDLSVQQSYEGSCAPITLCGNSNQNIIISAIGDSSTGNNFAFNSTSAGFDLTLHVGWTSADPGFQKEYWVMPYNLSPVPDTGVATIIFVYDSNLIYQSSLSPQPAVDTIAHTLTWNINANSIPYPTFDWYNERFISYFTVPATLNLNYQLQSSFLILPKKGDCDTINNYFSYVENIAGSHDPNYKEVSPSGTLLSNDSILTYTIHYQNTGTDSTYFITVTDTLSPYLDPTTVRNLASNAPYSTFEVTGTGLLTWVFEPYSLVDSATNSNGSKGFITFSVKMRHDAPSGAEVSNAASVYFDYNPPITTNTVTDTAPTCYDTTNLFSGLCSGDSVYFYGRYIKQTGLYDTTLIGGCDTFVILTLVVQDPLPATQLYDTICANDSVLFNGLYLDTTGIYNAHFSSVSGCDSVVSLTLTVNALPVVTFSFDSLVAAGDFGWYILQGDSMVAWCGWDPVQQQGGQGQPYTFQLKGGSPFGGIYSGTGVFNDTFYIDSTISTFDSITYSYTNANGCSASATGVVVNNPCFGIAQISDNNFLSLFPNPATDQLYIKTQNIQPVTLKIYDADGRMIYTIPFKPVIDINELSSGVYFVEVTSNEGVARKRFVKM